MEGESHLQTAQVFAEAFGYPEDKRVRAVFLVGSSASGKEDAYSDIDMMVVVDSLIPLDERLDRLLAIGGRKIMMSIAGANNPALPVESQVIDKFVFQDNWFDVSYHLPDQLEFCFDYVTLVDKDGLTSELCVTERQSHDEKRLKARAQADLRLLHARIHRYEKYAHREEWVGLDLSTIKRLLVDLAMVLNERPNYNRHSSRISQMLRDLPIKPDNFEQDLLDILHLDNRQAWSRKLEMLRRLEADLTELCEARWGPIAMFDDEGEVPG